MHPKNFAPLSEGLRGNGCFKITPSKNLCQILRRLVVGGGGRWRIYFLELKTTVATFYFW